MVHVTIRERHQKLPPHHHLCFFFNDPATTEIYTLSLHDALPISTALRTGARRTSPASLTPPPSTTRLGSRIATRERSEEHTSELQSRQYLVCRLLLEKKQTRAIVPDATSDRTPARLYLPMDLARP